jgi:thiol-disulfide isomerase/thioredoxin
MANITQIISYDTHDALLSRAEMTGKPTVIYVSNSPLPACKKFTPQYESFATKAASNENERREEAGIEFAQMELSSETSNLFKFAPNQLPVLVFMCRERLGKGDMWCKTVMGADLEGLEVGVREMMMKAKASSG